MNILIKLWIKRFQKMWICEIFGQRATNCDLPYANDIINSVNYTANDMNIIIIHSIISVTHWVLVL